MQTVGLLIDDGFQLMSLAALSAFEFANVVLGRDAYRVSVISDRAGPVSSSAGVAVTAALPGAMPDTLLVVGQIHPQPLSPLLRDYVARAGREARRVAGVCTGAFGLAEAGLLNGRRATTHWGHARRLQKRFPAVKVDADRIFLVDGNIWTSAGMTAAIDLALALIEADHGTEVARDVARRLVVYHRRPGGQSQFSALLELDPRSDRVRRALAHVKEHLAEPLSVDDMAAAASLSPRQFSRLFRAETGQSPAKAIEQLRIEAARLLIAEGRLPLDTIARDTGFGDRNRMRRAFVRACGHPPLSVRRSMRLVDGAGELAEAA